jgi:hypothetical protein
MTLLPTYQVLVMVDGAEIAESINSPSETRKLPVWCGKHLGQGIARRPAFRVCHPDIQWFRLNLWCGTCVSSSKKAENIRCRKEVLILP